MRAAVLFTDGVGVGADDPSTNPLSGQRWLLSQFADGGGTPLPPGGLRYDVDTCFGIAGRPQSASNQTALWTGLPAPALIGQHVVGFPTQPLVELIETHGVARRLKTAGRTVSFINGYPVSYLEAIGVPHTGGPSDGALPPRLARRLKPPASALLMRAAQVPLRTQHDIVAGRALTHDIDGRTVQRRFADAPTRSPAEAATLFWAHAADFTLFEHYLADEAGHAQSWETATAALATFDAFARAVIQQRPDDTFVVICSDHGNVEDLSLRQHTRNAVAVLTFGAGPMTFTSVADVGRAITGWLGCP
jgi:hypothetical protein